MADEMFNYQTLRSEWVAEIGYIDQYGDPRTFDPYWTSDPFPTREGARAALEGHSEVLGYDDRMLRYRMARDYTRGEVSFRQTKVAEFNK